MQRVLPHGSLHLSGEWRETVHGRQTVKTWLIVAVWLLLPSPGWAQTCPGFPARGVQIIDALYNPALANGTDDDRRQLTRTILEQMVFEMPNDGWTWKSADSGRPPSKDSLARIVNGRLCNYDWQNGGTRRRSVQAGQIGEDITGQNPIPVAGINHLGDVPQPLPGPSPQPVPPPVQTDLTPILQRLDNLYAQSERMFAQWQLAEDENRKAHADIAAKVDNPGWFSKVFGSRYTQMILAGVATWLGTAAAK